MEKADEPDHMSTSNNAEASNGAVAVLSQRRRVGRIAGLPYQVREVVNRMILDGVSYDGVAAEVAKLGYEGVSRSMLSRWVRGGFAEWLSRRERRTDRLQRTKEMAAEVARMRGRNRNAFAQMNHVVVAEQLNEVLEGLDAEYLLGKARKDPAMFFRLVRAVNSQFLNEVLASRAEAEVKKLRAQEREKKAARRAARTPKRGGVTEEELERITERMNL